jgi:hypothetical protein
VHRRHTLVALALVASLELIGDVCADGRIILIGDEWLLSDDAFNLAPDDVTTLTLNCAGFLAGNSGPILGYSNNPIALSGRALSSLLAEHGYGFTLTTAPPFTLATLMQYDAVWLAGVPGSGTANAQALIDYVHAGGNVLIAGGTGEFGSALGEAFGWTPFLNEFGLALGSDYFPVQSVVTVPVAPPSRSVLQGVSTLVWGYGQFAFAVATEDPATQSLNADFSRWRLGELPVIATYASCPSLCPGDLDGNGTVDAADLSVLLGAWGATGGSADLTCDGIVNAADLGALLGGWGACLG